MINDVRQQIVKWAMDLDSDLALYRRLDGRLYPGDSFPGSLPGPHGGEIHLISQTDASAIYAETTDDIAVADYVVGSVIIESAADRAVRGLLDVVFGDRENWPDNYAQTAGWNLPSRS